MSYLYPSFFRENYPNNLDPRQLFMQAFKKDNAARLTLISEFTPLEIMQAAYQEYCEFGNADKMDLGFQIACESEEYHHIDYIMDIK